MRLPALVLGLAVVRGALASNVCTSDSCIFAVTGSDIPVAPIERTADCASFIAHTSTPPPTSTLMTSTTAGEDWGNYDPTAVVATNTIPTYAVGCTDAAAYSSACSCASVSVTTVTAPIPTIILYEDLPNCENPGSYPNWQSCGDDQGVCIPDSGGSGWCISDGTCEISCTLNSHCLSGICLFQTACGDGTGTCYDPSWVDLVTSFSCKKKSKKRTPQVGRPLVAPGVIASLQSQAAAAAAVTGGIQKRC